MWVDGRMLSSSPVRWGDEGAGFNLLKEASSLPLYWENFEDVRMETERYSWGLWVLQNNLSTETLSRSVCVCVLLTLGLYSHVNTAARRNSTELRLWLFPQYSSSINVAKLYYLHHFLTRCRKHWIFWWTGPWLDSCLLLATVRSFDWFYSCWKYCDWRITLHPSDLQLVSDQGPRLLQNLSTDLTL